MKNQAAVVFSFFTKNRTGTKISVPVLFFAADFQFFDKPLIKVDFSGTAAYFRLHHKSGIDGQNDCKGLPAVNIQHLNFVSVINFRPCRLLPVHGNKRLLLVSLHCARQNFLIYTRKVSPAAKEIAKGKSGTIQTNGPSAPADTQYGPPSCWKHFRQRSNRPVFLMNRGYPSPVWQPLCLYHDGNKEKRQITRISEQAPI